MAIAEYPRDFSYFETDHLMRELEINEELPSINTNDPMAIDMIAMFLWLDAKYDLDHGNQIVFEIRKSQGLACLTDFHINVTFCDPRKADAAQQLNETWHDLQRHPFDEVRHRDRQQRVARLIDTLYATDSEVLFVPPVFITADLHRRRYVIPKTIARTTRTIRVRRMLEAPRANTAYTVQPNGTRVRIP